MFNPYKQMLKVTLPTFIFTLVPPPQPPQCHGLSLFNKVVLPFRPLYILLEWLIQTSCPLHPGTRSFPRPQQKTYHLLFTRHKPSTVPLPRTEAYRQFPWGYSFPHKAWPGPHLWGHLRALMVGSHQSLHHRASSFIPGSCLGAKQAREAAGSLDFQC